MDSSRQTSLPRRASLNRQWSRLLAVSWAAVAVAVGIVGSASLRTGKPLWWIGGAVAPNVIRSVALYLFMVGVILLALRGHGRAPLAGIAVALLLAVGTVVDLVDLGNGNNPGGSALVMMSVAGAALLASLAAVAGVVRRG